MRAISVPPWATTSAAAIIAIGIIGLSTAINIDPETMAKFDNPARLSRLPSRTGSKRRVYMAGLAILQRILVDGHKQANSLNHEFISAK